MWKMAFPGLKFSKNSKLEGHSNCRKLAYHNCLYLQILALLREGFSGKIELKEVRQDFFHRPIFPEFCLHSKLQNFFLLPKNSYFSDVRSCSK